MENSELMTVGEVSALLRVRESWVYARTSGSGERIPHLKFGKLLRFRRSEILRWADMHHTNFSQSPGSKPEGQVSVQ
jgi:excisionase family DNA binding protein